jgi:hypothetical protein
MTLFYSRFHLQFTPCFSASFGLFTPRSCFRVRFSVYYWFRLMIWFRYRGRSFIHRRGLVSSILATFYIMYKRCGSSVAQSPGDRSPLARTLARPLRPARTHSSAKNLGFGHSADRTPLVVVGPSATSERAKNREDIRISLAVLLIYTMEQ